MTEQPTSPLQDQVDALRHAGMAARDPMGFHFLDVMSQRVSAESGPLKHVLEERLRNALAQRASPSAEPSSQGDQRATPPQPHRCMPLAELNRYLQGAAQGVDARGAGPVDTAPTLAKPELKSVRRFTQTWSRIVADDQLEHAFGRGPENAGPLNSHMLMLRSLSLMRALSPDYLRRFMSHVDSLLWLAQATPKASSASGKVSRRSRSKR